MVSSMRENETFQIGVKAAVQIFYKIGALKNFAIFSGKHMC